MWTARFGRFFGPVVRQVQSIFQSELPT